jgi:hypothetical protein
LAEFIRTPYSPVIFEVGSPRLALCRQPRSGSYSAAASRVTNDAFYARKPQTRWSIVTAKFPAALPRPWLVSSPRLYWIKTDRQTTADAPGPEPAHKEKPGKGRAPAIREAARPSPLSIHALKIAFRHRSIMRPRARRRCRLSQASGMGEALLPLLLPNCLAQSGTTRQNSHRVSPHTQAARSAVCHTGAWPAGVLGYRTAFACLISAGVRLTAHKQKVPRVGAGPVQGIPNSPVTVPFRTKTVSPIRARRRLAYQRILARSCNSRIRQQQPVRPQRRQLSRLGKQTLR